MNRRVQSLHPVILSQKGAFAVEQTKQSRLARFLRENIVAVIAFCAAVITSLIVPVDEAYLGYLDFKTLTCLFCVLAVVCALKEIHFFYILAQKIVQMFKNARMCIFMHYCYSVLALQFPKNPFCLAAEQFL